MQRIIKTMLKLGAYKSSLQQRHADTISAMQTSTPWSTLRRQVLETGSWPIGELCRTERTCCLLRGNGDNGAFGGKEVGLVVLLSVSCWYYCLVLLLQYVVSLYVILYPFRSFRKRLRCKLLSMTSQNVCRRGFLD